MHRPSQPRCVRDRPTTGQKARRRGEAVGHCGADLGTSTVFHAGSLRVATRQPPSADPPDPSPTSRPDWEQGARRRSHWARLEAHPRGRARGRRGDRGQHVLVEAAKVGARPTAADGRRGLGLILCRAHGRERERGHTRSGEVNAHEQGGFKRACAHAGPHTKPTAHARHEAGPMGSAPGQGRRMRVSARPGEKSSDQSRVVICERAADEAVEYCDENGSKAVCERVCPRRSRDG